MDRGAWWATVHGVAKSRTQLSHYTNTSVLQEKKVLEMEESDGHTTMSVYLRTRNLK